MATIIITAQIIYVNGATEPSWAFIRGVNGTFRMTGKQWRVMQMLARSGSRFL